MTTHRSPQISRSASLFALIFALLAMAAGPAAAAPPPTSPPPDAGTSFGFTVRPYNEPGSQPRPALEYEIQPGQAVQDRVAIVNGTDKAKAFYLYAADAYNTSGTGGFALRLRTEQRKDAGGWITLPAPEFTVPAHTAALVPVQINVPRGAEPGDHTAGVVAEEIIETPQPTRPGAGVVYLHRVATRVYVRVAGPVHPRLQVTSLKIDHHEPLLPGVTGHGGATIDYTIRNSGNVRLTLNEVHLKISGLFGRTLLNADRYRKQKQSGLADDLLPGNSVTFGAKLTSLPAVDVVTAAVSAKATDPVVHRPLTASGSSSFVIFPWLLVLIIVALVAGIWLWRRRRRSRASAADRDPAVGADGPGPAGSDGAEELGPTA